MSDLHEADRRRLMSRSSKIPVAEKVHPSEAMDTDKKFTNSAMKLMQNRVPATKLEDSSSKNIAAQPLQYYERDAPKTSQGKRPGRANPEPQVVWGQMQSSSGESV